MAKNDSRTKAFATNAKRPQSKKKSRKSKKRIRHQVVISIFAVIALILIVFATLIIGKILTVKKSDKPGSVPSPSVNTVPREETAIHIGNLLLINASHPFDYSINDLIATSYDSLPDGIVNLWTFKNNASNFGETKIHIDELGIDVPTYELANPNLANQIALEESTLHAFNQMLLDYCGTLDLSNYSSGSASKINVAWGWSHETGLYEDIEEYGESFHSQADGKSITLMQIKSDLTSVRITEAILKNDFEWIYQHAHEYGFIIRYPDNCINHTGFSSNTRIHLRYIGVEHATYIYNHGCCLEEYLKTLRDNHGHNNPLVINSADGKTYEVYYVEYSGNPTSIPVPKDKNYYISGDNMNGFIVTVEK